MTGDGQLVRYLNPEKITGYRVLAGLSSGLGKAHTMQWKRVRQGKDVYQNCLSLLAEFDGTLNWLRILKTESAGVLVLLNRV